MSGHFPASNVSLFDETTNLEEGDIIFAVYETTMLEAPQVGYSAPSGIASAGSVVWSHDDNGNPETVVVALVLMGLKIMDIMKLKI